MKIDFDVSNKFLKGKKYHVTINYKVDGIEQKMIQISMTGDNYKILKSQGVEALLKSMGKIPKSNVKVSKVPPAPPTQPLKAIHQKKQPSIKVPNKITFKYKGKLGIPVTFSNVQIVGQKTSMRNNKPVKKIEVRWKNNLGHTEKKYYRESSNFIKTIKNQMNDILQCKILLFRDMAPGDTNIKKNRLRVHNNFTYVQFSKDKMMFVNKLISNFNLKMTTVRDANWDQLIDILLWDENFRDAWEEGHFSTYVSGIYVFNTLQPVDQVYSSSQPFFPLEEKNRDDSNHYLMMHPYSS